MSKILCYELNEVPWRLVDYYIKSKPGSNLAALLSRSAQFTTHTVDTGELHPWSTWPTVHRGVSNEVHKIHYLNQDLKPAESFPPIWQMLADQGHSCGIFGSLQSYPPVEHNNVQFHVPDTFAAGSTTIPARYEPFQAFNLMQTGENKAEAGSTKVKSLSALLGLLRTGIKTRSYLKVVKHLLNERKNPLYKSRRALLQPVLAFDVFLSCLKRDQPEYVTFFSNHVAGIMHRYWKYTFPEDFDYTPSGSGADQFHKESLMSAMDLFDSQLGELFPVAKKYGYQLVVMSSMGQEAIDRGEYEPELKLENLDKLLNALQIDFPVTQNLAMQPDVAFEFETKENLNKFQSEIQKLTNSAGEKIFMQRFEPVGLTLNLSLRTSKELVANKAIDMGGHNVSLKETGLSLMSRDIGTAYHQPKGILIWEGFETSLEPRAEVDSRAYLPTLLNSFGIEATSYMQPKIG